MPRPAKGPRLYLKPASAGGRAVWIIRDGGKRVTTGCSASDVERAAIIYFAHQ